MNEKANITFKQIQAGLANLAGQQKAALQKVLGQAAIAQASLGVRMSRTPYGQAFAPLTSRVGIPLRRTGNNIQRSWTAGQETPTSFVFGSRFKWLKTHQYGAVIKPKRAKSLRFFMESAGIGVAVKKGKVVMGGGWVYAQKITIPRRQMIPEMDTGGLGARWTNAFKRASKDYMTKLFKAKAA